jgi:ubiquinone/menaquinone biosynthesis C-methylase UbiE
MGRFASTTPYYRRCREPYSPEFFRQVAQALHLDGSQALLDLGCGPGLLALGFAPFVRRVVGVDPEPTMIAAAADEAAAVRVPIELIESRTEDLPASLGSFDVATFGRSLHWMTPAPTLAVLTQIVAPRGCLVVCRASSAEGPANPWLAGYDEFRHRVSPEKDRHRYGKDAASFFGGSAFCLRETLNVQTRQTISVETLVGRLFSMSNTSREMLGSQADSIASELRELLSTHYAANQTIKETVESSAMIFARSSG